MCIEKGSGYERPLVINLLRKFGFGHEGASKGNSKSNRLRCIIQFEMQMMCHSSR